MFKELSFGLVFVRPNSDLYRSLGIQNRSFAGIANPEDLCFLGCIGVGNVLGTSLAKPA